MRRVVETIATSAPSPARRRAVAYPMPLGLPAPVTSATRPSSRSLAGAERVADSVAESRVTPLTDSMGESCRLVRLTATRGWPYPVATAPHPRCPAVPVGGGHCDIASIGRRDNALYAGRTGGKSAGAPAPAAPSGNRA